MRLLNQASGISPRSLPLLDSCINNSRIRFATSLSYSVNGSIFIVSPLIFPLIHRQEFQ